MEQAVQPAIGSGSTPKEPKVVSPDVTKGGFVRLVEFIKKQHAKSVSHKPVSNLPQIKKYQEAKQQPELEARQKGLQLDTAA